MPTTSKKDSAMDSGKINENWDSLCARVKEYDSVDASQVDAFFSRLQPQAMSEGFLMLTADNDFIKTWVERHYVDLIKQGLLDLHGVPFTVVVEVAEPTPQVAAPSARPAASAQTPQTSQAPATATPQQPQAPQQPANTPQPQYAAQAPLQQSEPTVEATTSIVASADPSTDQPQENRPAAESSCGVVSTCTFENFVIGDSNRMAYSMAVNVAEMPGRTPLNPFFIYGKSGLGKTHLMRAIQNYICETQPHLRTVYVDSTEFLSEYVEATNAHDKEKSSYKNFKTRYEDADVLLIDDIQGLQGKKETLGMVFQIHNKLIASGKQIVYSADRAPKNIDIDERYHSRFSQGATIDIQPPEIETKLGIVKSFIKEYCANNVFDQFDVPEDVQMYIAENSGSNIRELRGAVTKVLYQMTALNQPNPTIADVRVLLENHFSGGASKNLTVEDVQKEVENFFRVKHSDLVGPSRARSVTYPRQVAIYLCRQTLDLTFGAIGKKFNRDHATIMHSVGAIEEKMRNDREVQEEIEALTQIIREL